MEPRSGYCHPASSTGNDNYTCILHADERHVARPSIMYCMSSTVAFAHVRWIIRVST